MNLDRTTGVLVEEVTPGSFADDIGFLQRDVIVEINRKPVNTVDDLKRIQASLKPGDAVAFQVMRRDQQGRGQWSTQWLAGKLPANH